MKQPLNQRNRNVTRVNRGGSFIDRGRKNRYGTSQLERTFAKEFLDKLKLSYIYQFHAKDIGRYYDFAVATRNNGKFKYELKDGLTSVKEDGKPFPVDFLVEVDGGYYHADPRVIGEKKLNGMQRRNVRIDEEKNEWASRHHIPLFRFWEYDIRNNPKKVMERLIEIVGKGRRDVRLP